MSVCNGFDIEIATISTLAVVAFVAVNFFLVFSAVCSCFPAILRYRVHLLLIYSASVVVSSFLHGIFSCLRIMTMLSPILTTKQSSEARSRKELIQDGSPRAGERERGPRPVAAQLDARAHDIRAMHEQVQLSQDPQTEFALICESLGVSRVNHILRVHGREILEDCGAAKTFDDVGLASLERLFRSFTEEYAEQASLGASQAGSGVQKHYRCRLCRPSGCAGSSKAHEKKQ